MRLYRTAAGQWAGTQADARALAGKDWTEIEVPTDKPGLLDWLNRHEVLTVSGEPKTAIDLGLRQPPIDLAELAKHAPPPPPAPPTSDPVRAHHAHDVAVEEAIHAADLPRAIRLCECAMHRVREHAQGLAS